MSSPGAVPEEHLLRSRKVFPRAPAWASPIVRY